MHAALTLATMLAQAPAEAPPAPPVPSPQVHTDTSHMPLDILNALPAPASFDYDGDQLPEAVTLGTTKSGQVTLTVRSTRTGRVQVLYISKRSLAQLGATHVGLKAFGEPKSAVTLEVWGVKGGDKVAPISLGLTPSAISLVADGKTYDFSWSGTGFKTLTIK